MSLLIYVDEVHPGGKSEISQDVMKEMEIVCLRARGGFIRGILGMLRAH